MTLRQASALSRNARSASGSQPSTFVHAAQCTMASGCALVIAASVESRFPTSRSACAHAMTSCGASASTSSRPTWPPAPVTSTRMFRSAPRGRLVHRGAAEERSPPCLVVAIPADRLGEAALELDLGVPSQLALDLRPVEDVPPVVTRTVGHDLLQGRRQAEGV